MMVESLYLAYSYKLLVTPLPGFHLYLHMQFKRMGTSFSF